MAAVEHFTYRPLDSSRDFVRLLTLEPGQFSDTVCATITHEKDQPGSGTTYECLSYTWGKAQTQLPLHLSHKETNRVEGPYLLQCMPNLQTALKYLRYSNQPRIIWADAICINQSDVDERNKQVAQMGEIYASADRVVVWLGEEEEHTAAAFEVIERLSGGIELLDDHRGCRTIPGSEAEAVERHFPESMITPRHWSSLNELIIRPWFERLWVRQEVQLASRLVIKCGSIETEWGKVEKVIIFVEQKVNRVHFRVEDILRCRSLFRYEGSDSVTYALHRSSFCRCANERDRVYANLSTSSAMKALRIKPDYTLSVADTFKNMMTKYMQRFQDLDLLRMCDIDNVPPGFPTFVPNFAKPGADSRLLSVYAHAGAQASVVVRTDGAIQVKGRRGDVINLVSKAKKPLVRDGATGGNHLEIIKTYHHWEPDDLLSGATYPGGGSMLEAFVTLLSNGFCKETYNAAHLPTPQESIDSFLEAFSSNADTGRMYNPRFKRYLGEITSDRRPEIFFRTVKGYMGTSPSQVQDGDTIAVLLGASVPMVLRPASGQQGVYFVVGPCYLQGFMFGETLLGALPDRWTCVQGIDRRWCFRRQGSDTLTGEDPRLVERVSRFDEFRDGDRDLASRDEAGSANRPVFDSHAGTSSRRGPSLGVEGVEAIRVVLDEFALV